jgi:predicted ferric reductase
VRVSETGLVAYVLLFASIATGAVLSSPRVRSRPDVRPWASRAHELLSLAGLLAAVIHTLAGVVSPQRVRWALLLFLGPGGGAGLASGTASVYAMILVTVTFYLRGRIGSPLWRWIHALAYPAFAAAAWHGVALGANAWLPAIRWFYAGSVATAGLLASARITDVLLGPPPRRGPSTAGPRS